MKKENLKLYYNDESDEYEFMLDLANFCKPYVNDVVNKILNQLDDILATPFVTKLLHQLRIREEQENEEFIDSFKYRLKTIVDDEKTDEEKAEYMKYNIHNHCTIHADSYRDILYDLLIK